MTAERPEIDTATPVPECGIAATPIDPALRLAEAMGKAAQLGAKRPASPCHLANLAHVQQHMLVRRLPVDEEKLHPRTIETPGGQIVFRNRLARKTARHLPGTRAQPHFAVAVAGRKAAGGKVGGAAEHDHLIMIGKTDRDAILQCHLPAMACGRRISLEMLGKGGGNGFHGRISISGMEGMRPAWKTVRFTSIRSIAKRTGTSNSKPARIAAPAGGTHPARKVTMPVV
ncbi:Uncharacterised protein [Agrobacterium tumefaciens]|nr:Uncharacterised protein [Agrobacterium tumefaciens]